MQQFEIIYWMQLIPLNETIYFNATQMSLLYVYLLAFTYHPLYPNILYLLYGQKNHFTDTYDSMHLLIRDSNSGSFLQNSTLTENYDCLIDCEIKATSKFFMIESQSLIGIYENNVYAVNTSSYFYLTAKFSTNYALNIITRFADIFADKFVIVDSLNQRFILGNSTQRITVPYPFNFSVDLVLFVGMYDKQIMVALNASQVAYQVYACHACMFNGSNSTSFIIKPPNRITVTSGFRIYRGFPLANYSIIDGVVYWGFNSRQTSPMIIANDTHFQTILYLTTTGAYSTANHENLLFYGEDTMIYNHKFNRNDANSSALAYGAQAIKMAITSDSSLVSVKDSLSNWNIQQYQFVDNCSSYLTFPIYIGSICFCSSYNSTNRCSQADPLSNRSTVNNQTNQTNSSLVINNQTNASSNTSMAGNLTDTSAGVEEKGSFPIGAVVGVIAGLVVVTASIIFVKKNYQRCIKGRRRTPWKYNPTELMSFET